VLGLATSGVDPEGMVLDVNERRKPLIKTNKQKKKLTAKQSKRERENRAS